MNIKNRKTIIFSTIFFLVLIFFSVIYHFLNIVDDASHKDGKRDNYFNQVVKKIVPQNIKNFAKDKIFVFERVKILEAEKRPVSAVADNVEVRDVIKVAVVQDQEHKVKILFDGKHSFEERILNEQFKF